MFFNKLIENKKIKNIWKNYYSNNFISQMRLGNLDKNCFKYYLIQDNYYLTKYLKMFAYGIIATNNKNHQFYCLESINSLLRECNMQIKYCKKLNINLTNNTTAWNKITKKYTDELLKIGKNYNFNEIIAAISPCTISYGYIGNYLIKNTKNLLQNFYKDWIKEYSSIIYNNIVEENIKLINEISKNMTNNAKLNFINIFLYFSKLELKFWEMNYEN